MVTTSLPTMTHPSYDMPNFFNHSGRSPVMRKSPPSLQSPFQNFASEAEGLQEIQYPLGNTSSDMMQNNIMMNPQLEYNMMIYMKRLNYWHNTHMARGQSQMFYNQMGYQNFMARIGVPFLRMF